MNRQMLLRAAENHCAAHFGESLVEDESKPLTDEQILSAVIDYLEGAID